MSKWKTCILALLCLLMAGCAAPRFDGKAIDTGSDFGKLEIVIVDDTETREGFRETVEKWLRNNGYNFTVKPEGSKTDLDKLTIEYVGHWKWDLALFLSEAHMEAFHQGQRVGQASYKAPNSLNANKFGEGEERIQYMLEVLFGKISAAEATKAANKA